MRLAWIALVALVLSCGGKSKGPGPSGLPAAARAYPATRWIPSKPTYVLASRTLRQGQQVAVDLIDALAAFTEVDVAIAGRASKQILAVDIFSATELANIGVDLEGGFAVFSEGVSPTLVVHLSSPEQFQTFLQAQRDRGLRAESQIVEGAELFTMKVDGKLAISWAVVDDWLWLRLQLPIGTDQGPAWFTASRRPGPAAWAADWQWASAGAEPALLGFVDLRGVVAKLSERVPDAVACTRLLEPVTRAAMSVDGDGKGVGARVAFDVGPSAAGIQRAVLPAPEGWSAAAAKAPLSGAWNLDLDVVARWAAPCATAVNVDLAAMTRGVRAARVVLQSFDPDDKSGTGAIALDVSSRQPLASLLDRIPLRSKFESNAKYGPYAGKHLSIPFGPKLDYVLTDRVALAAMGDGLLARIVGKGGTQAGPVLAVDVIPGGLSREAWLWLLEAIDLPAQQITDQLLRWREIHVGLTVDDTRLVFQVAGNRK